jgi:hypothetical protein
MAAFGRKEPQGRLERQGASLLQRRESREAWVEGSSARGRATPRLFLRPYEGHEKEVDERKDRKRSEFED